MKEKRLFWITGLAGSGKSTLASHLVKALQKINRPVVLLDGDTLREIFQEEADYSRETRLKIAWRNARLCKFLVDQGIMVVCATISLFHEIQRWNRENIDGYCEIYLDISLDILMKRDQKSLYTGSKEGIVKNVVGVDIPAEFPLQSDYVVCAEDDMSLTISKILTNCPP